MKRTPLFLSLMLSLAGMMDTVAHAGPPHDIRVYVGTYTRQTSRGIYTFKLNSKTGETTQPELAAETENPSFVAISPDRKFLYAVNEVSNFNGNAGKPSGGVTAYKLNSKTGKLTQINSQPTGGGGACHLAIDGTGKTLIVANYGGGSISSFPIAEDGSLKPAVSFFQHTGSSVNLQRQKAPHAHSVNFSPDNKFAVVADLGIDQLLIYRTDTQSGSLTPNDPPYQRTIAGGGPRHLSFHPSGNYAYSNNEMLLSVTAYKFNSSKGELTPIDTYSTVEAGTGLRGNSTAETLVHPSGNFLYVSNRGPNSIAAYRIQTDGSLKFLELTSTRGETPRGFGIDPSGQFLIAGNQSSDTVVLFRIDPQSGGLTPQEKTLSVSMPVNVRMLPIE